MNSVQKKPMMYLYDGSRVWCQLDTADYCPVIIVLMSSIIFLSCVLIVYLCARTSFRCVRCRRFSGESDSRIHLDRSSVDIAAISSQVNETRPAFSKAQRPPPSYEESLGKTRLNRVIRTYPRQKQSPQVNAAFCLENERHSVVFPEYTCLSLVTSSATLPRQNEHVPMADNLFQNDEVPPSYEAVMSRTDTDPDVVYF